MTPNPDQNRDQDEHYIPTAGGVELTDSAKASVKAVETMRGTSGQIREAAEHMERRKRRNREALTQSRPR